MASLFGRRKRLEQYRPIPVMVPQKTAEDVGFTFELLSEKTVDECVDAMIQSMPQVKWNRDGLRRGLLSPNALSLAARRGGSCVAVISGTVFPASLPPPTIGLMAVTDPASGELGVGSYIIDEYIKAIQKRSPKATFVDVSLPTDDTGSIALYSLKGFVIEGYIRDAFHGGLATQVSQDLVILRRRFTAPTSQNIV